MTAGLAPVRPPSPDGTGVDGGADPITPHPRRGASRARGIAAVLAGALASALLPAPQAPAQTRSEAAPSSILLKPSCARTRGGIAVATPGGTIYYCLQRVVAIESRFPHASRFFFLHEYGHIALQTGDEPLVDCWAARELRHVNDGETILAAARRYVEGFKLPDEKYGGTGADRSELLQECHDKGLGWLKEAREQGLRPPALAPWGE